MTMHGIIANKSTCGNQFWYNIIAIRCFFALVAVSLISNTETTCTSSFVYHPSSSYLHILTVSRLSERCITTGSTIKTHIKAQKHIQTSTAMTTDTTATRTNLSMNIVNDEEEDPICKLPGDPTLTLSTNVDLGTNKLEFMKAISKGVAAATGKPESYVAVTVTDNASILFGGTDTPAALGSLTSIGSINKVTNGQVQGLITDLLVPYGIDQSRIYINFFDMPRDNVGWNRKTFGG